MKYQNGQLERVLHRRIRTLNMAKEVQGLLFAKFIKVYESGFLCCYCGNKMDLSNTEKSVTVDHIIPRKLGGKDTVENLTFCCRDCNFQKKAMDAEKYRGDMEKIKLRKKKKEYWKAKKSSKNDEQTRESYKDIFQIVNAKKERAPK